MKRYLSAFALLCFTLSAHAETWVSVAKQTMPDNSFTEYFIDTTSVSSVLNSESRGAVADGHIRMFFSSPLTTTTDKQYNSEVFGVRVYCPTKEDQAAYIGWKTVAGFLNGTPVFQHQFDSDSKSAVPGDKGLPMFTAAMAVCSAASGKTISEEDWKPLLTAQHSSGNPTTFLIDDKYTKKHDGVIDVHFRIDYLGYLTAKTTDGHEYRFNREDHYFSFTCNKTVAKHLLSTRSSNMTEITNDGVVRDIDLEVDSPLYIVRNHACGLRGEGT